MGRHRLDDQAAHGTKYVIAASHRIACHVKFDKSLLMPCHVKFKGKPRHISNVGVMRHLPCAWVELSGASTMDVRYLLRCTLPFDF